MRGAATLNTETTGHCEGAKRPKQSPKWLAEIASPPSATPRAARRVAGAHRGASAFGAWRNDVLRTTAVDCTGKVSGG